MIRLSSLDRRQLLSSAAMAIVSAAAIGGFRVTAAETVANDAIRTVMVKVGFTVLPDRKVPKNREATSMESDIYVRLADPSRPLEGPRCV